MTRDLMCLLLALVPWESGHSWHVDVQEEGHGQTKLDGNRVVPGMRMGDVTPELLGKRGEPTTKTTR